MTYELVPRDTVVYAEGSEVRRTPEAAPAAFGHVVYGRVASPRGEPTRPRPSLARQGTTFFVIFMGAAKVLMKNAAKVDQCVCVLEDGRAHPRRA
eukprot:4149534-Prymnesium_polylepis.1